MPIAGHVVQTQNFLSLVYSRVATIIKKRRTHTAPSDGLVLKLHYRWTFWFLAFHFAVAYYNLYSSHLLSCVNKFNGNAPIADEFINFCTSYIYVKLDDSDEKRYLFFYKWLHYVNIILAFFYYMTRKLNKFFEKPIVTKLFEQLHPLRDEYGDKVEKLVLNKVSSYLIEHLRTHNSVFYNTLGSNFFALMINLGSIGFIDFVLQGRFISYGFMTVPFKRDMVNFTDYMSRTFPPFAECTVGKQHEITAGRIQSFGCHLVLMELYEKLFFILWVWLMLLSVLTVMYITFLVLFCHPYVRWWALHVRKPDSAGKDSSRNDVLGNVLKACKVGDSWLLYKLKKNLSTRLFYMLLSELSQPNLKEIVARDPTLLPKRISGPLGIRLAPTTPSCPSALSSPLQKNLMIRQKLGLPEDLNFEVYLKADKSAGITPWSARDTLDTVTT